MGKVKVGKVFFVVGIIMVLLVFLYLSPLTYLYCLVRESSWEGAKNRGELEARILVPHSQIKIAPKDSMHGKHHVLLPGQEMIQYKLFGKEPLDVVYFADGRVAVLYFSYE